MPSVEQACRSNWCSRACRRLDGLSTEEASQSGIVIRTESEPIQRHSFGATPERSVSASAAIHNGHCVAAGCTSARRRPESRGRMRAILDPRAWSATCWREQLLERAARARSAATKDRAAGWWFRQAWPAPPPRPALATARPAPASLSATMPAPSPALKVRPHRPGHRAPVRHGRGLEGILPRNHEASVTGVSPRNHRGQERRAKPVRCCPGGSWRSVRPWCRGRLAVCGLGRGRLAVCGLGRRWPRR